MSASESRQRTKLVAVRLTPDEHRAIVDAARHRGQSVSMLIRLAAIGSAVRT